jgi:hypothetical protein
LEAAHDQGFGAAVGLGNEIEVTLVGNAKRPFHFFTKDFSSFLGDFDGGFEKIVGHSLSAAQRNY